MCSPQKDEFNDRVIDLISNYQGIQEVLSGKVQSAKQDYASIEKEFYYYVTMTSPRNEMGIPTSVGGGSGSVEITVLNKEKEIHQIRAELAILINRLEDEMIENHRIHLIYMALPMYHHMVLQKLYEEHETWEVLRKKMRRRKSTLVYLRNNALTMIRAGFFSELPIQQFIGLQKNAIQGGSNSITWDKVLHE